MKTIFKKISKLAGLLLVAAFVVQGCSDVADSSSNDEAIDSASVNAENVTKITYGDAGIYFGKNRDIVGSVNYISFRGDIYFDISTDVGIEDIHIWVGNDLDYPQSGKKGTPIPGRFPYNSDKDSDFSKGVKEYFVQYSASGIDTKAPVYMIIHFALENGETAFSGCFENEDKGRWFNWIQWGSVDDETNKFNPASLCGAASDYSGGGGGVG